MTLMARMLTLMLAAGVATSVAQADDAASPHRVQSLRVTTLSTMLADRGMGEWGYAALVEADGHKILFDTGYRPDTVLNNARELGIDLSEVEDVVLSHNHDDHTGGLLTLRKALRQQNAKALSRVHVGRGIFDQRVGDGDRMQRLRRALESDGVVIREYAEASELFPGVWLTGNVERVHPERNWSGRGRIIGADGEIEDTIAEDMSLVIDTSNGFVLIAGCGHAGIINTMEQIVKVIRPGKIDAAIGGFHLMNATEQQLHWTAEKLKSFGLTKMIGAHCTGIDSLYSLRRLLGASRKDVVVGAVGDYFTLEEGVRAASIAR